MEVPVVFRDDDEVGRDLAAVDWAATPLGPPDGWPQSLRTAVNILLSSHFSMWLAWGPELTFLCNAAYRRDTLGKKYPWALGKPASLVWDEIWGDIGPRIDTVLTTGRATWDEALLLFLGRSGYPEESYHTFSYSPLRDDTAAVAGILCVVSEETDRVIGERRMATLRDLGSDLSVVRSEPETLAFASRQLEHNGKDLPFTLTYVFHGGRARLACSTGIAPDHPLAPAELTDDPVWPVAALARGESALVDLTAVDDLPRGPWPDPPTTALVVPLPRQGGSPYGFLVAALNRYRPMDEGYRGFIELVAGHLAAGIASAKTYQAQLRRAEELSALDRAKTTFFSNVSHEFRTPLALIMGPVEELRDRLTGADDLVRDDLDLIHRNGLRLGKLVNALLDFSRIEAGRMQARYAPTDLAAVTAELASVFRSAIDKADLKFVVDCPPLPEPVHLDRGLWEKVVLNLLSNALKYTFDGTISVTVRAEDGEAVVTVADTGVGVPPAEMPRLFERFHRIENSRSRSNEGSGIGLALVQELVSLHGGAITADSVEGEGTRFTIRLPFGADHLPDDALRDDADPEPASAAEPFVQEALRWLPGDHDDPPPTQTDAYAKVLIADDNSDMRDYLTRLLTGAGYEVDAVTDGVAALQAIRASGPDLVISDVMMPRMGGLTLVATLRGDPRTAALPVLLLSARAGQEAAIEGLRAGADDYLVKPFPAAELLARVRTNIELARLRNHHARWRTALVDSLTEGFFVADETGQIIEINAAFTEILGYGPEGLPYGPDKPWWPDAVTDPEGHQRIVEIVQRAQADHKGSVTVPVVHRDGHQVWITATFNRVKDPDTGGAVIVGTFRDVTAEHYAVQRDAALAALSVRLTEATSLPEALTAALAELKALYRAERVTAVAFSAAGPALTSTDPGLTWDDLGEAHRAALTTLRARPALSPMADRELGAGIIAEHPDGPLALWLDLGGNRPFAEEDQLLLSLLGGHLAQGLRRAHQIDVQRETAIALQRVILGPAHLLDGFAVRYEPAARPLEVGGDWYDTVPLPDGRIGIVVGDCVGRGLEAAAVMGQLRSACRALLLQDGSPAQTLMALDRFAAGIPGAICTTVFCGILQPETGHLTYTSAGHPPAILTHPNGTPRLLDDGRSVPLAVRPGLERSEAECTIDPRATLLVYTDGLIERRRRPLDSGIGEATAAVQAGRDLPVDDLATRLMDRLAPAGGYEDDVALLLYRHPGPLDITFPAEPAELGPVRAALRGWLRQCGLPEDTVQGVLVAAGEACANAIEHGYRDTEGASVRLRAEASVADLHLAVTDSGRWQTPNPEANPHRGRGLSLMRAIMEDVRIDSDRDGTTVTMHLRIP